MVAVDGAVRDILGPDLSNAFDFAFRRMDVAEQEISAAKKRCPRRATALHGAFVILVPGEYMRGGEELYRRHCRELLARVKRDEDLDPATDAEIAYTLSQATLAAPPDADHAAAYAKVFERVFPEKANIVEELRGEYVPGRSDKIIADLRRKIGKTTGRTKAYAESLEKKRARKRAKVAL